MISKKIDAASEQAVKAAHESLIRSTLTSGEYRVVGACYCEYQGVVYPAIELAGGETLSLRNFATPQRGKRLVVEPSGETKVYDLGEECALRKWCAANLDLAGTVEQAINKVNTLLKGKVLTIDYTPIHLTPSREAGKVFPTTFMFVKEIK